MTGGVSNSFFHPEVKCDFNVSHNRKMIWAILIDLLKEFNRVCEKYSLSYYAICGTLLGAIRHSGFIPWDDDLDVAMPREDYEKLKNLKFEFKYPYNLVWPEVEAENGYSFIKLRNSETTAIPDAFSHLNIDQGIFLDIFPLDDVKSDSYYEDQDTIKELLIKNTNNMKLLKSACADKNAIKTDIVNNFKEIEEIAQKDNGKGYSEVALRTISFYSPDHLIWNKEDFLTTIIVRFEETDIRVPIGWEKVLETTYGDWRTMPPVEERGKWHSNAKFDPCISYKKY